MAKARTLRAALDRQQGVDYHLEKQKKQQKAAEKRKRKSGTLSSATDNAADIIADDEEVAEAQALSTAASKRRQDVAANGAESQEQKLGEVDGCEPDEEDAADEQNDGVEIGQLDDESDSDSEDEFTNGPALDGEESEDIPYSDIESLASEDRGDIVPHQKLTINNTAALQRSLKSFALPSSLPFSAVQAVTSAEPVQIADVEDDLNRELAFYKQSLDAAKAARIKLKQEGVSFTRPADYFAEMVKSEEQMGKVRQKLVDEAARKKASADARRQRDLKKFGKAVQVAKSQERDRAKRDTMDKINALKRKRQGAELNATEDDLFDVALEDAAETEKADKADRRARRTSGPGAKRQKKDEKFGFGGKKKYAKSNDAKSTSDMQGYSVSRMKGKTGKQRPGKSRRAKAG